MIKIAISGKSGRMGQALISAVKNFQEIQLISILDKDDNIADKLKDIDTLIDFTRPEISIKYLEYCHKNNKKMVIGTTGFSDEQLVKISNYAKDIAIVLAPNMSIGINLTLKLLELSAKIVGEDADIEIIEAHHRYKVDAPSGTALKMAEVIANTLGRDLKKCAIYNRNGIMKPRNKKNIGFSVIRGGDTVGEHSVYFFLDGERLEITHRASSRQTFANGAIKAAIWLKDKKNTCFNMQDVLGL